MHITCAFFGLYRTVDCVVPPSTTVVEAAVKKDAVAWVDCQQVGMDQCSQVRAPSVDHGVAFRQRLVDT